MSKYDQKLLGAGGEKQAEDFLKEKGYRWMASNWRSKWGEIDLIMKDGPVTVFVEVKTRRDQGAFGEPEEAVTHAKRAHLLKSAMAYLQKTGTEDAPARFDVISVGAFGVRHFEDAFANDTGFYL